MRLKIELGVLDAGPCTHDLNITCDDTPPISKTVAMAHGTVTDIRDDFHVDVAVRRETAVRRNFVIVPDAQRAPARTRVHRQKMVLGLEPIALITGKRLKGPTFDHRVSSESFAQ